MRVLIDAHMVGQMESGNERYVLNLLRALAAQDSEDSFVVAASCAEVVAAVLGERPGWRVVQVSASPWQRLFVDLPRLIVRERIDLVHVTYTAPLPCSCRIIGSVHDVSYLEHPEWFSARDRVVLRVGVGMTVARGAHVLAPSEDTCARIRNAYGLPSRRICVAPLAADPCFVRRSAAVAANQDLLAGVGIRRPFALAVGNLQPRKNLPRLVRAFAEARRSAGLHHMLVIAGKAKWRSSEVFAAIRQEGLEDDVVFTGYISDDRLSALYNAAECFIYPSLYEGFGLPVLEAMACGAPVISSNVTSIPELAEGAALLVDPESVGSLAGAVGRVLTDAGLREELRQRGMERVRRYTWDATARKTLEVYRRAAHGTAERRANRSPDTDGDTVGSS